MSRKVTYDLEKKLVAYCGIYCRECDYYTGAIAKVGKELYELLKRHSEFELFETIPIKYEDFLKAAEWLANFKPCLGCRAGDGWSECPARMCAEEKGVEYCFECAEFPCTKLKEKLPWTIDRLKRIKEKGLEDWIKEKLESA